MSIDVEDFETEVIARSYEQPIVVDFWAEWCGPCRTLGPVLERLEGEGGDWTLAKVNVDEHQAIANEYGVRGIPAVKLFVGGEVVGEFTGALPESQVANWLDAHLPNEQKQALAGALALLQEGRRDEALSALEALVQEPNAPREARIFLAQVSVLSDPARALGLVEGVGASDEHADLAQDVRVLGRWMTLGEEDLEPHSVRDRYLQARVALAAGDFRAAIEQLIACIATSKAYDEGGARKACIAVFNLLGRDHELVQEFRRSFQSALN